MAARRSRRNSRPDDDTEERNIEIWKLKKLIKGLEKARGNGTSMISLILPPKDKISRASQMLAYEMGTASNIRSRINRLSVQNAITSVQQRLKLYSKVPPNGLVIYCGNITTEDGKQKMVNIDIVPFKPINTTLYLCDNKFHLEALNALLTQDERVGFIVIDGNGTLFGSLQGTARDVLHKLSVDLPKKHSRGGQSALRFSRLRSERRHNYLVKVCEYSQQLFLTDNKPNVTAIILAGSADFKNDLREFKFFDQRLSRKILKVLDVAYGGESGFNHAIELAADSIEYVKYIQEKKLIGKFFEEIAKDTGKCCYGVDHTFLALEMGAVSKLICMENLDIQRYVLKNNTTNEETIRYLAPSKQTDKLQFKDKDTGAELDVVECQNLLDWLVDNYKSFGTVLEIISEKTSEGNQFWKGFGGIGGLLRHSVNFSFMQLEEENDEN